ncbi:hypothetical protein KQI68_01470 [Peptoniphilus sp. MSJ-1]|uniref:Helix-turn-helix domain-containing protein n=1 Tax=Peptoniphilus ovalis TaxID=2841503 RepID=A0ABS6FEX6_9FIRM|nr:helix-turn-helix domain-containing protein [Peptoniphilus ovalis]MBU5668501.1 hypothetical protein [Peptoniphilus ovalis]
MQEQNKKDFLEIKDIERIYRLKRRAINKILKTEDIRIITGGKGMKYRINKKDFEDFMEGKLRNE